MKKLAFLLLFFFTLFACDNRGFDDKIQKHFPFEFEAITQGNYFVGTIGQINVEITNEHEYLNQDYTISYEVVGGDNEIFYKGELIKGKFLMKKEKSILDFKGLKTGIYKIKFTATNGDSKYDKIKEIQIEVINKPFEPSVTADNEVYVSETKDVIIHVKVDDPKWVTYSWEWTSKQDNELKSLEGSSIAKETTNAINPNREYQLIFNPKQNVGEHILFFTFKDTQGQQLTVDLKINVKNIEFETSLNPIKKEIFFDEIATLDFSLVPEFIPSTNKNNYRVTYKADGTEGIITIDGNPIKHYETLLLENIPFEKKTITFEPTEYKGASRINFEIEDKFNYKKTISADISIKLREYEFFAKKVSEKALLPEKETGEISTELKTLGDISKLKYKLRLVSDSKDENNGYFMFRGKRINYNDDFYLTDNFDKITYHPTAFGSGKHQISFQLKDITGQAPKNNVGSISFDIYKPMELKSLKFDRTHQKIVHNDFVKPIYNMEYFVSYELEMSSKLKSVVIRGYDKRNGKNFEKVFEEEEIKNPLNNFKFESVNRKTGPQDVFEPGDELTIIFTDDRDMTLTLKSKMKAKE